MEEILEFVGEIYEAAYRPDHWDYVLKKITDKVGAKSAGLFSLEYDTNTHHIIASTGLPQLSKVSYRFGLGKYDYAYNLMTEQKMGDSVQIVDHNEVKDENPLYYRLLLKPNNVGYVSGLNIVKDDEWYVGLGIHRSMQAEPFGQDELQFLETLYPHIRRSLKIYRKFQKLEYAHEDIKAILSDMLMGIVIVNEQGSIKYCNPAAKALLNHHPAIYIRGNHLHIEPTKQKQAFDSLMAACLETDKMDISSSKLSLTLEHPHAASPLNLLLGTLNNAESDANSDKEKTVAIYLSNPEANIEISFNTLSDFHGLSPAEIKLTLALVNGLSLQEYADNQNISVRTARSQLASVFEKTGVNRQQDLVSLVLQSPAGQVAH